MNNGRYGEAVELYGLARDACLARTTAGPGRGSPRRGLGVVSVSPKWLALSFLLAEAQAAVGQAREAAAIISEIIPLAERAVGPWAVVTLEARSLAGRLAHDAGRAEEAERLFDGIAQDMARVLGAGDPRTMAAVKHLASTRVSLGKFELAAVGLVALQEHLERMAAAAAAPATLEARNLLENTLGDLASIRSKQGRLEECRGLYDRLLAMIEARVGRRHPNYLTFLGNSAAIHCCAGDPAQAMRVYEEVLRIQVEVMGDPGHPSCVMTRGNVALMMHSAGDCEGALALSSRNREIAEESMGADTPFYAVETITMAGTMLSLGRPVEAMLTVRQVLRLQARHRYLTAIKVSELCGWAGLIHAAIGDRQLAQVYFWGAWTLGRRVLGDEHEAVRQFHKDLGRAQWNLDNKGPGDPWVWPAGGGDVRPCAYCLVDLPKVALPGGKPHRKTCSGCWTVRYCNRDHQRLDWEPRHRLECQGMREARDRQREEEKEEEEEGAE